MTVEGEGVHPDEGTIHAWLDEALPEVQAARIEAHVAACAACAERVAEARGLIAGASRVIGLLDETPTPLVRPVQDGSLWRKLRVTPARAAIAAMLIVAVGITLTRERTAVESTATPKETGPSLAKDQVASAPMPQATPAPQAPAPDSVLKSAIARRLEADQPARTMKRIDGFSPPPQPLASPAIAGNVASVDTRAGAKVAEGRERRVASEMSAGAAADRALAAPAASPAVAEASCLQLTRADGTNSVWEGVSLPVRVKLEPSSSITSVDGTEAMGNWSRVGRDTISIVLRGSATTTSGTLAGAGETLTGALSAMPTQLADAVSARKAAPARVEQRPNQSAGVAIVARRISCPRR